MSMERGMSQALQPGRKWPDSLDEYRRAPMFGDLVLEAYVEELVPQVRGDFQVYHWYHYCRAPNLDLPFWHGVVDVGEKDYYGMRALAFWRVMSVWDEFLVAGRLVAGVRPMVWSDARLLDCRRFELADPGCFEALEGHLRGFGAFG